MPGITSLNRAFYNRVNAKRGQVALIPLNSRDVIEERPFIFQYFPETLQDNPTITYQKRPIPGATLPLYSWINNDARTISFTAEFSCDLDIGEPSVAERVQATSANQRNVDIRAAIARLRSFCLPTYSGGRTVPPRKLVLCIENSGIGAAYGSGIGGEDSILCVMTQCSVSYDAFFPSNVPRLVSVQLAFEQLAQYQGTVDFPSLSEAHTDYINSKSYKIAYTGTPVSTVKKIGT